MAKLSYEPVSYEADKDTADKLLEVLKDCGMSDAYMEYDEISSNHTIYVNKSDFLRAEDIVMTFHDDLEDALNNSDSANDKSEISGISKNSQNAKTDSASDTAAISETDKVKETDNTGAKAAGSTADGKDSNERSTAASKSSVPILYADSTERYKDNLSSAYTFVIIGTLGVIALVLYDFGLIPILSMTGASKILFNVVAAILFVGFIIGGIFSFKYSKKLRLAIDVDAEMTDKILEYLKASLTKDDIENSCDTSDIPEEMKYYRRTDAIKACIASQFDDCDEALMNDICDKYYNSLFS